MEQHARILTAAARDSYVYSRIHQASQVCASRAGPRQDLLKDHVDIFQSSEDLHGSERAL